VSTIDSLPGEANNATLRSVGLGLSFITYERFSAALTWADPLLTASRTHSGGTRVLFSVKGTW